MATNRRSRARPEQFRHLKAFEIWFGSDGNYKVSSETLGVPEQTLRDWANRYGWSDRASSMLRSMTAASNRRAIEEREKTLDLHRKVGKLMVARAMQYLQKEDCVKSATEAATLAHKGSDMERLSVGLPAFIQEVMKKSDQELMAEFLEVNRQLANQVAASMNDGESDEEDEPEV